MAGTTPNGEGSITFRLDPSVKTELSRLAQREHTTLGALLRDMARDRLEREKRSEFEREAARQSQEAAAVASQVQSDEHRVMEELASDLDDTSET